MMKKFLLLMMMVMLIAPVNVQAEQAAAEHYRKMFREGNFYVECQMFTNIQSKTYATGIMTFAGQNGNRMYKILMNDKSKAKTKNGALGILLPGNNFKYENNLSLNYSFFRDIELPKKHVKINKNTIFNYANEKTKLIPDVLYKDGKYYKINDYHYGKNEKKVFMLSEDKIDSPNLNPKEEWQYARSDLALPDELAIFNWNDKFHENTLGVQPYYNGSSKRTIDDKEYDCDQYLIDIKSMANTIIAQEAYNMIYNEGQLIKVQKYLIYKGKEYLVRELIIINITSKIPEDAFKVGEKVSVYEGDTGSMADLLKTKKPIPVS